jgi:hypothetical protein
MGIFSAVTGAASSVASAYGTKLSAKGNAIIAQGQVDESYAQATAIEQQASAKDADIRTTSLATKYDIQQQRKVDRMVRGRMLSQIGKSGVELEGSTMDVLAKTAQEQELNIITTRYNSRIAQERLQGEARALRVTAQNVRASGHLRASGTLLGGVGTSVSNAVSTMNTAAASADKAYTAYNSLYGSK